MAFFDYSKLVVGLGVDCFSKSLLLPAPPAMGGDSHGRLQPWIEVFEFCSFPYDVFRVFLVDKIEHCFCCWEFYGLGD